MDRLRFRPRVELEAFSVEAGEKSNQSLQHLPQLLRGPIAVSVCALHSPPCRSSLTWRVAHAVLVRIFVVLCLAAPLHGPGYPKQRRDPGEASDMAQLTSTGSNLFSTNEFEVS